jgi:glyceraldehyde-3-phosphate dehydrogenase (NADP+)
MQHILQHSSFYDGKFQQVDSGLKQAVYEPFSGKLLAEVACITRDSVNELIESSRRGFEIWSSYSAGERAKMLDDVANRLEVEQHAFVELLVREAGKPIRFARTEVERAVTTLRIAAQEALRLGGEIVPMDFGRGIGKIAQTQRYAAGVILGFSPFNFPLNLALHKIAPALASGCSIVMKAPNRMG